MKRPNLASMAWRNLWRNTRRTLLTLSSIAFGAMLAILFTGIGDANWAEMIELAARMGGGHVTLQHPEYLDTPTLSRTVADVGGLRDTALRDPDVKRVVTRISGQVMLSTATQSYGAAFLAFDPSREDTNTLSLLEAVSEGEVFRSKNEASIILGHKLSENLDAGMGRKVVYTMTDRSGEIVRDVARVSGIVKTGSPSIDAGLSMLPIDRMRQVLGYAPDEAVHVALFLDDQRAADDVAGRMAGALPSGVSALPWYTISPDLSAFIAMKVAGARFMEIIIMLLVAAGIFNTLFVGVMERVREFGIMMALGFSSASLFVLVMLESLWMGLMGLVFAGLVTALPYWYLNTTGIDISSMIPAGGTEIAGVAVSTIMRADIYTENLVVILLAALTATLLSGVYPAWKAGRIDPVESIRLV